MTVLVDAVEGCTTQDMKILNQAVDLGKGAVLVVNKWDLVEKDHNTSAEYTREVQKRFPSLRAYPILFTSGPSPDSEPGGPSTSPSPSTTAALQESRHLR